MCVGVCVAGDCLLHTLCVCVCAFVCGSKCLFFFASWFSCTPHDLGLMRSSVAHRPALLHSGLVCVSLCVCPVISPLCASTSTRGFFSGRLSRCARMCCGAPYDVSAPCEKSAIFHHRWSVYGLYNWHGHPHGIAVYHCHCA